MTKAFADNNQARWRGVRPAHKGTQVAESLEVENDTGIVYTVTSGNTLFLTGIVVTFIFPTAGDNDLQVLIRDGDDTTVYSIISQDAEQAGTLSVALDMSFDPLEIPAGYDIVLTADGANNHGSCFIKGWEE